MSSNLPITQGHLLVCALMVQYIWWEGPPLMKELWKYVLVEVGEQCVLLEMNCSCSIVLSSISLTPTTFVIIAMMLQCSVLVRRNIFVHFNNHIPYVVATVQNCTDWNNRLVGGSSPSQGRVEVCYMNQWGTICSNGQTVIPAFANVICRQLGYSFFNPAVYPNSYFGGGSGGIYLYTPTLLCTGNESRLQDC